MMSKVNDRVEERFFKPEDVVSTYASGEAVEDGVLFDVDLIAKRFIPGKRFFLKYITTGLLAEGYWNIDETLNVPNLLDLLCQLSRVFAKKAAGDYFVSGVIELPSGKKQKVFMAQNETGRFTAMLPEDW
jgi:hypothetical protein